MKTISLVLFFLILTSQSFADSMLFYLRGYVLDNPTPFDKDIVIYVAPEVKLAGFVSSHTCEPDPITFSGEHYLYVYAVFVDDDYNVITEGDWYKKRDINSWTVSLSNDASWNLKAFHAPDTSYNIDYGCGTWTMTIKSDAITEIIYLLKEYNPIKLIPQLKL